MLKQKLVFPQVRDKAFLLASADSAEEHRLCSLDTETSNRQADFALVQNAER